MEHERYAHHELLPETRALIAAVERQSGRGVVVRADPQVASRGRAIYVVSDPDVSRDLVLYDPSERRHLDHLVAHEVGHVIHFSEPRPADRRVPVLTAERRAQAMHQLAPEFEPLRRGLSPHAIAEVVPLWLSGTVAQLSDTPSDIRIERWLFQRHPGLRAHQRASLLDQVRTLQRVLTPAVERVTPRSVWLASNAMNYVLAKTVADILSVPGAVRPYLGTPAQALGEDLIALAERHSNQGLAGDRRVTDAWAACFGFADWFEWRRVDELPGHTGIAIE